MVRTWILITILCLPRFAGGAAPTDLEEETRALSAELRCVVCQNLSVADSPSEMAQQMRAIVREQLEAGKTPDEIKDFFVSKYGEWVLLNPRTSGFGLLLWILPYAALLFGLVLALWFIRRWASEKPKAGETRNTVKDSEPLRNEILQEESDKLEIEDSSPRAELLRERQRLREELGELEFDYQSGKHSETGFTELRSEIENKAARVIDKLRSLPPESTPRPSKEKQSTRKPANQTHESRQRFRRWQIAAGGSFLLFFGLALGILLTQSLRPRTSEQDTITGDFLTGTRSSDTSTLLQEGKRAFDRQEFAKAIDAFKQVLERDPNQPEAHAYMGFILVQAGHSDGALMAFDKALANAPSFPMALWGKGMVLYQDKQDFAGARATLEKLMGMMSPGEQRDEIAKVLAEIPSSGPGPEKVATVPSKAAGTGKNISGQISIDSKLMKKIDRPATLFIIVRQASSASGPPLAVKKIDNPSFPLSYSLGAENVMIQGMPFAGKINVTARLDKDGNAMTREAGNLLGDYKNNPVEVGSQTVDIVLDHLVE